MEVELIAVERISKCINCAREVDDIQHAADSDPQKTLAIGIRIPQLLERLRDNSHAVHGGFELRLEDVSLAFGSTYALRSCTMTIPAGAKLAVVGRTGAGKSSLISTLQRLYPFEGNIFFNSEPKYVISVMLIKKALVYLF